MVMGMIDELLGCWCFGYAPQRIYMKICVMNLALIYRFHALVPLVVGTAKSCMPLDLIEKRPSRCFVESISKVVDIDVGKCHRRQMGSVWSRPTTEHVEATPPLAHPALVSEPRERRDVSHLTTPRTFASA